MTPNNVCMHLIQKYVLVVLALSSANHFTYGQLTCTKLTIDTMSVEIAQKNIGLKHISQDTFRAYVYTGDEYSTFLFSTSAHQVASEIMTYKETYYDGLVLISSFSTRPDESMMRNTFNYVCRGTYEGPYFITDVENGSIENNKLNGVLTVLKTDNYGWYGTTSYRDGLKHGDEMCTNGRYTNIWEYADGNAQRLRVSKDTILLRDETYQPTYKLKTYDDYGNLTRLQVNDSIELYYKNNVLRYSLTYNQEKDIWESQSFYPSGKVERYQPHKTYRYTPLEDNKWYSEDGKLKPEPDPELMIEEDMQYQTLRSSVYNNRTTAVSENQLLNIKNELLFLINLEQLLAINSDTKVKKKQLGSYQFELEVDNLGAPSVAFTAVDRKDQTIYQHVHYTLEGLESDKLRLEILSNYEVKYIKALVGIVVTKP